MAEAMCCGIRRPVDDFPMPTHPDWPQLRAGTQLDAIYERLMKTGSGFRNPAAKGKGLAAALVVIDPQCPWSHVCWENCLDLADEFDFVWFPVCVSKDCSTAQAAAILKSANPWETMRRHHELFVAGQGDPLGIRAEDYGVGQADRDRAWNNARIYRKAGGTSVPLGIRKTADGRYVPFFGKKDSDEIRAVMELA